MISSDESASAINCQISAVGVTTFETMPAKGTFDWPSGKVNKWFRKILGCCADSYPIAGWQERKVAQHERTYLCEDLLHVSFHRFRSSIKRGRGVT